jgi:hypothetical protein
LPLRSAYARAAASIRMLAALEPKDDRVWFAVHLAERGVGVLARLDPAPPRALGPPRLRPRRSGSAGARRLTLARPR